MSNLVILRKDYIDGRVTHDQYYSQYVTPRLKLFVEKYIGRDKILASNGWPFNDIPRRKWDALHGGVAVLIQSQFKHATGCTQPAMGDTGCAAKQAARHIYLEASCND